MLGKEIIIRDAVPSHIKIIMELLYLKAEFDFYFIS